MTATNSGMERLQLCGRVLVTGRLRTTTGLHVGRREGGLGIGQAAPVLRDPLTYQPYIPGSTLRGKLRSLLEKRRGFDPTNEHERQDVGGSRIHACRTCRRWGREPCAQCDTAAQRYEECLVCPVFGLTSDMPHAGPTRLVVRDLFLSKESADRLEQARTDLPYTEVKTEVAIDRVTAASNPRDIERVPPNVVFDGLELAYGLYEERDLDRFRVVPEALALLEEDYLGGHGARGYGKVQFEALHLQCKDYRREPVKVGEREFSSVGAMVAQLDSIWEWMVDHMDFSRSRPWQAGAQS